MAMNTAYSTEKDDKLQVRTNSTLKADATKVLSGMQLDLSTVVNLLLAQIVKQNKVPFEVTNDTAEDVARKQLYRELFEGEKDIREGRVNSATDVRQKLGL